MKPINNYFQELNNTKFGKLFKYIGPGFLVTVGFIDPGNWAANISAGSEYGYTLLWVVLLSTIMLVFLQNNSAKLGIASGICLAEATSKYMPRKVSKLVLISAMGAVVATIFAEILGGAIALQMLIGLDYKIGVALVAILVLYMVYSNSYRYIEKWIIGFVSIIGLSFLYELTAIKLDWPQIIVGTVVPKLGSQAAILTVMSVLGAVVMPHNLFIHSESIQSREFDLNDKNLLKEQIKYAKTDTLLSMIVGFLINSAIVILAAAVFYDKGIVVTQIEQAQQLLVPLLGDASAKVFAIAFLFAGIASSVTAIMTGGIISAGMANERYNANDRHTSSGLLITTIIAIIGVMFVNDTYQGLILSQVLLSLQLPITIIAMIYLTNSPKVMGEFVNTKSEKAILMLIGGTVIILNLILLWITFTK